MVVERKRRRPEHYDSCWLTKQNKNTEDMFSGLFSSVQSPKALFADKLAGSLATYFEVDPAAIQTSLLTDAKIVLHDVRLKPQNCCGALLVGGVAEIEFAWKWGGSADGSTSFVRETILSIRGASLRLMPPEAMPGLLPEYTPPDTSIDDTPAATTTTSSAAPGFMDRHIQAILDHLTLNITDVEISVEGVDPKTGKMVLEAKELQLLSFGRKESELGPDAPDDGMPPPCLSQRLSVGSIQAYIVDGTEQARHPLIDPISYSTSVRRVSGRRFLNFTNGLEVVGEFCGSDSLVIHGGSTQVAVLSKIADDLLSAVTIPETSGKEEEQPLATADSAQTDSASTLFSLPLPSLVLCLPNDAKIRMPRCLFQYRMDGSEFCLKGSEGILVNDSEKPLLQLMNSATWNIDFASSRFSVSPAADGGRIGQVIWSEQSMKHLLKGALQMQKQGQSLIDRAVDESTKVTVDSSSPPWSFAVGGEISVQITGKNDEWIQMSVDSPDFLLSNDPSPDAGIFASGSIVGAKIGPTSFGNATVHVPSLRLSTRGDLVSFQAPIRMFIPSTSTLSQIQAFAGRLVDDIELGVSTEMAAQTSISRLPFAIEIPSVEVNLSEPKAMVAEAKDVQISRDRTVKIKSMNWSEESSDGNSGSILGLSLSNEQNPKLHVARVESMHLPGAVELASPIEGATLVFENDQLHVDVQVVKVLLCSTATDPEYTTDSAEEAALVLPFPVHLNLEKLSVQSRNDSEKRLLVYPVHLSASPAENRLSIEMRKPVNLRLESSANNWLDICFESSSISLENGTFLPKSFSCGGVCASSPWDASLKIPRFQLIDDGSKKFAWRRVRSVKFNQWMPLAAFSHLLWLIWKNLLVLVAALPQNRPQARILSRFLLLFRSHPYRCLFLSQSP